MPTRVIPYKCGKCGGLYQKTVTIDSQGRATEPTSGQCPNCGKYNLRTMQ